MSQSDPQPSAPAEYESLRQDLYNQLTPAQRSIMMGQQKSLEDMTEDEANALLMQIRHARRAARSVMTQASKDKVSRAKGKAVNSGSTRRKSAKISSADALRALEALGLNKG